MSGLLLVGNRRHGKTVLSERLRKWCKERREESP